jgi:hypothetical protein
MVIHHVTPYRRDKHLAVAYNEAFECIGDDDWCVLRDIDTMFLTPDAPNIIEDYIKAFPDTGIFTCYTNRLSLCSKEQLFKGIISANTNILYHTKVAESLKRDRSVHEIKSVISGFLMVISKKTWKEFKFHGANCLGVDYIFSQDILDAGMKIRRMNGLYVFHLYRLLNGVHNTTHLAPA